MRKSRRTVHSAIDYSMSFSDILSALVLLLILVLTVTACDLIVQKNAYIKAENERRQREEEIAKMMGFREEIGKYLKEVFGENGQIYVDEKTGDINLKSDILFDFDESALMPKGQSFLRDFLPKYISVLMRDEIRDNISEIIIVGYTDSNDTYLNNLKLSQDRARAVADFSLNEDNCVLSASEIHYLESVLSVNGKSESELVYTEYGSEDPAASRRVEIKFSLVEEEQIQQWLTWFENPL